MVSTRQPLPTATAPPSPPPPPHELLLLLGEAACQCSSVSSEELLLLPGEAAGCLASTPAVAPPRGTASRRADGLRDSWGPPLTRAAHLVPPWCTQEEHYNTALELEDKLEQQRAATELGNFYLELYLGDDGGNSEELLKAKRFLKISFDLAVVTRRETGQHWKELVDAYANLGNLRVAMDDLNGARTCFQKGLQVCDSEEVADDESRSRIHHQLGLLYTRERKRDKALHHIREDIRICNKLNLREEEAKGYISVGDLHFKFQEYDSAIQSFRRAEEIVRQLQDEEKLLQQTLENLHAAEEARKEMQELQKLENELKRVVREAAPHIGTPQERSHELKQLKLLFAVQQQQLARRLGDMEKLADSAEAVGKSHYNLRNFEEAQAAYQDSLDIYRRIKTTEGEVVALIGLGNTLDSMYKYNEALALTAACGRRKARASECRKYLELESLSLTNMQYSYLIRMDDIGNANKMERKIKLLEEQMVAVPVPSALDQGDRLSESDDEVPAYDRRVSATDETRSAVADETVADGWREHTCRRASDSDGLQGDELIRESSNSGSNEDAMPSTSLQENILTEGATKYVGEEVTSSSRRLNVQKRQKRLRVVWSDDEGSDTDSQPGSCGHSPSTAQRRSIPRMRSDPSLENARQRRAMGSEEEAPEDCSARDQASGGVKAPALPGDSPPDVLPPWLKPSKVARSRIQLKQCSKGSWQGVIQNFKRRSMSGATASLHGLGGGRTELGPVKPREVLHNPKAAEATLAGKKHSTPGGGNTANLSAAEVKQTSALALSEQLLSCLSQMVGTELLIPLSILDRKSPPDTAFLRKLSEELKGNSCLPAVCTNQKPEEGIDRATDADCRSSPMVIPDSEEQPDGADKITSGRKADLGQGEPCEAATQEESKQHADRGFALGQAEAGMFAQLVDRLTKALRSAKASYGLATTAVQLRCSPMTRK
eukprot:SM000147S01132  [mRNA]  locus=s147:230302:234791:- [translate_table: standard]